MLRSLSTVMPRESEIISRLRARRSAGAEVLVGIGDDAAVIKGRAGRDVLACCDLMVEGVHFRTEWTPPRLLGHKALAVNLSDIAAMGGVARFALVSIAVPARFPSDSIDQLFEGLFELAGRYDVSIVGGDTSSSRDSLFIDVSVIGDCASGRAVTRAGARPGDTIYVSGSLGGSSVGLSLLEEGVRLEDDDGFQEALLKHLAPEPRLRLGHALGEAGLVTSMIDISDGLSTDLWHLLEESNCGAVIRSGAIPIAECTRRYAGSRGADSLRLALNGGEEYELLFTAPADSSSEFKKLNKSLGITITEVGEVVEERGLQIEIRGALSPLLPSGYEHAI